METGIVSQRKFASMVGCSEGNVRAAIAAGKIKEGVKRDAATGKVIGIDVAIATKEWSANLNTERIRNDEQFKKLTGTVGVETTAPVKKTQQARPAATKPVETNDDELADQTVAIADDMDISEARRQVMILQAKLMNLDLQQKEGKLADITKLKKVFFDAGVEIRTAITMVPNACIDNVLSAETRVDALRIMTEEINKALETIVNVNTRVETINTSDK
jgi:hypothetical protein